MAELCKQEVRGDGGWHWFQCSRNATKDGYCWQHHPDAIANRAKESIARYEEKERNSPWRKLERMTTDRDKLNHQCQEYKEWIEHTLNTLKPQLAKAKAGIEEAVATGDLPKYIEDALAELLADLT